VRPPQCQCRRYENAFRASPASAPYVARQQRSRRRASRTMPTRRVIRETQVRRPDGWDEEALGVAPALRKRVLTGNDAARYAMLPMPFASAVWQTTTTAGGEYWGTGAC